MAKTSTSSARRGRHLVGKDYTSKIRFDAYERERDREAKVATAGMIENFASGVASHAETLKTNMKGWEQLEAGGEELHKKGIEAGTIKEGTKFDLATSLGGDYAKEGISKWDMWTSQAPVTKQMQIGKDKFYGVQVSQVGKLGESAGMLVDDDSDKSLYDFLKIGGDKTTTGSSLETMKKARPEQTSPLVQKITSENNTNANSSQSFTSAPDLQYPKAPATDINWDALMSGDVDAGDTSFDVFEDFEKLKAPASTLVSKTAESISPGSHNLYEQNRSTNYASSKNYGWKEFHEDSEYDWLGDKEFKIESPFSQ
jgi:hypothetical protein